MLAILLAACLRLLPEHVGSYLTLIRASFPIVQAKIPELKTDCVPIIMSSITSPLTEQVAVFAEAVHMTKRALNWLTTLGNAP